MRRKILLYYILLVVIGVSITGLFTSQLAHRFYKFEVEEKLRDTAALVKHYLSEKLSTSGSLDYDAEAKSYSQVLDGSDIPDLKMGRMARITFIDSSGRVLGDSDKNYREMENHLDRKEIRDALSGSPGSDIRLSDTFGVDFLYYAVSMEGSDVILRVSVPLIQLRRIDEIILYYTIAGIIAGILLTSFLAYRFSNSIVAPIRELTEISRLIAEGHYGKRAYTGNEGELGELSSAFNEMAARLEKTVADLRDKNIRLDSIMNSLTNGVIAVDSNYRLLLINTIACELFDVKRESDVLGLNLIEVIRNSHVNGLLRETVEKDISKISEIIIGTGYEKVLRIYTNPIMSKDGSGKNLGGIASVHDITNIRRLEQIRTEFVSNVTHELKTPLTSIRGFVETLRSGAADDRSVADKFLEIIDIEAERLYMLINDILQLSEIESKQKDSNIGTYSLKAIISEVVSFLSGVAEKKNVRLEYEVEDGIEIVANRNRLKQMLINLVDNGIKYNARNGRVSIKAYRGDGKIMLIVKDTGIGIAKKHLPRIFERFYRVDKGRSRSMGGTGLGLSIVKHIVNLYNGDIKVKSEPGKGTEFIIQLPH